jgi:hypothetical protein
MVRKCQGCGVENPDYSVFCGACGKDLVVFKDNAEKPGTASGAGRICEKCGTALPESGVCTFCTRIERFKEEATPDWEAASRWRSGITPIRIVGATIIAIGVVSLMSAIGWGVAMLYMYSMDVDFPGFVDALGPVAIIAFVIMGFLAVSGGYSAMTSGIYRTAVVGAISAAIIGMVSNVILFVVGIVCVLLVMMSKDDF